MLVRVAVTLTNSRQLPHTVQLEGCAVSASVHTYGEWYGVEHHIPAWDQRTLSRSCSVATSLTLPPGEKRVVSTEFYAHELLRDVLPPGLYAFHAHIRVDGKEYELNAGDLELRALPLQLSYRAPRGARLDRPVSARAFSTGASIGARSLGWPPVIKRVPLRKVR